MGRAGMVRQLLQHTQATSVLGVQLQLITPACELHSLSDLSALPAGFEAPWFAFVWPGGHGLTRFVQERGPELLAGRSVLEIGSGCGITSIACVQAGAARVVANDVCPMAGVALAANAEANGVEVTFDGHNRLGAGRAFFRDFDVVLCGDMLYDADVAPALLDDLSGHPNVVFADPGRAHCPTTVDLLAEYDYGKDGFATAKWWDSGRLVRAAGEREGRQNTVHLQDNQFQTSAPWRQ